jgi:FdhD protein
MIKECIIKRIDKDGWSSKTDFIAEEVQFTLFVNKVEHLTFLCSPNDYSSLAIGYLVSEGILRKKEDLLHLDFQELEYYLNITLAPSIDMTQFSDRKKTLSSGCGKGNIYLKTLLEVNLLNHNQQLQLSSATIFMLMHEFQKKSELFKQTGGVHSVGLCSESGILMYKEDIGRHNAVDKVLGACFEADLPLHDKALLLSGRMASEIVHKAAQSGIQVLLSKSAPSSMAIELAQKTGITLVGFIRGEKMNIYTHDHRIRL